MSKHSIFCNGLLYDFGDCTCKFSNGDRITDKIYELFDDTYSNLREIERMLNGKKIPEVEKQLAKLMLNIGVKGPKSKKKRAKK